MLGSHRRLSHNRAMHSPDIYRRLLLPVLITGVFILLIQACTKPKPLVLEPVIFNNTRILPRLAADQDPLREFKYIAALGNRDGNFETRFIGKGSADWCHEIKLTADPLTPCRENPGSDAIHVSQTVYFAEDSAPDARSKFLEALGLCSTFPNCP